MLSERQEIVEFLEDDPAVHIVDRAANFAMGGLRRARNATRFNRIGDELGLAGLRTTVVLRGGRTQEIFTLTRGVDPVVGPSLAEGFTWALDTPVFQDADGEPEVPTDEDRGIEVGNMYSYALDQDMTTGQVDRRYRQASDETARA